MIFNIQRFSTHDGRGIRTNVFFKGCPLRCSWCSNPESQSAGSEIMYDDRLCKRFGECMLQDKQAVKLVNNCLKINRDKIQDNSDYMDICPSGALKMVGENRTVEDLLSEIKKDMFFYDESSGGVTLTGGEPLIHKKLINDLLKRLNEEKISVSLETCFHVPWSGIAPFTGMIDEFLVDLKHTDQEKFRNFTGGNAELVLKNIRNLDDTGKQMIIRIPVIPTFNHTLPEMEEIINFVGSLQHVKEINFIPFHNLGKEKYRMLGRDYQFEDFNSVSEEELGKYIQYARKKGLKTNIGG